VISDVHLRCWLHVLLFTAQTAWQKDKNKV